MLLPGETIEGLMKSAHDAVLQLRLEDAIALCDRALAVPDLPDAQRDYFFKRLLDATLIEGRLDDALTAIQRWLNTTAEPLSHAQALLERVRVLHRLGAIGAAEQALDEGKAIAERCAARDLVGRALRLRADMQWTHGDTEQGLFSLHQAMAIHEVTGNIEEQINTLISIGIVQSVMSHFYDAILTARNTIALCNQINDQSGLMVVYNNIGEWYQQLYAMQTAHEYHLKALAISKDLNSGDLERNLGVDLVGLGRFDEGIACLRYAVTLGRKSDRDELLQALYSLADGLYQTRHLDEARKIALELLDEAHLIDSERHVARGTLVLGHILEALGDLDSAAKCIEEAHLTAQKTRDRFILWQTHAAMAERLSDSQPIMAEVHHAIAVEMVEEIVASIDDLELRQTFRKAQPVAHLLEN